MSKVNIYDPQFEPEYEDDDDDTYLDQLSSGKNTRRHRARRRIEFLMEQKKLREMLDMDDDYETDRY